MSNSDSEEREMAYLIEIWTDSEQYGGPESNMEEQDEDPDEEESPGERTEYHHPNDWVRWIESSDNKQRNRSRNTEQNWKNQAKQYPGWGKKKTPSHPGGAGPGGPG